MKTNDMLRPTKCAQRRPLLGPDFSQRLEVRKDRKDQKSIRKKLDDGERDPKGKRIGMEMNRSKKGDGNDDEVLNRLSG